MAKPSLFKHPKFLRLVHVLRMPTPHVLGHLELMWHSGFDRGDDFLGDEIGVELAAGWVGEPGHLCRALLACGFLDQDEPGQLRIHDLQEHAPDYVKSRIRMRRHRAKNQTSETSTHQQSTDALRNGCVTVPNSSELLRSPDQTRPDQKNTDAGASVSSEPASPASEPTPSPPSKEKIILTYPTVGKGAKEWHLSEGKLREYQEAFPGVDALAECRAALQWCRDNTPKRKTPRGMAAFLTRWLTKAQNSGGARASGAAAPTVDEQERQRRNQEKTRRLREEQSQAQAAPAGPTLMERFNARSADNGRAT